MCPLATRARARMLLGAGGAGALLNLALHVPASSTTLPANTEQLLLKAAGVTAVIAENEAMATGCLPVVLSPAAEEGIPFVEELLVDGTPCLWLRGNRKYVIERAAALSGDRRRFIASLPSGRAASESDLRRSCIMAWQLKGAGCSALVLSWPELEAAAATADSGWDGVAAQLARMRRPEWTAIHGG